MKSIKTLSVILLTAAIFISCGESTKEKNTENTNVVKEACTYSYISDSTSLKWTAYKFTDKVGVSGSFDEISLNNTQSGENQMDVLVGADFSINTSSVNSGNVERDPKLVKFFFEQLVETEMITGKIVSLNKDGAVVTITMNDKSVDVVGALSIVGNRVTLTTSIDMTDFEGLSAVASLNEVCSAKHTDEDGESKLWPDVDIVVSTVLKRECK